MQEMRDGDRCRITPHADIEAVRFYFGILDIFDIFIIMLLSALRRNLKRHNMFWGHVHVSATQKAILYRTRAIPLPHASYATSARHACYQLVDNTRTAMINAAHLPRKRVVKSAFVRLLRFDKGKSGVISARIGTLS